MSLVRIILSKSLSRKISAVSNLSSTADIYLFLYMAKSLFRTNELSVHVSEAGVGRGKRSGGLVYKIITRLNLGLF